MSALQLAQKAYAPKSSAIKSPRGVEYDLVGSVTRRLASAAEKPDAHPDLVAVLHENRRMWMFLASQVAEGANKLPNDLRARLLYLAEFTEAHTRKVLRFEETADVLVEINKAVMAGLRPAPSAP